MQHSTSFPSGVLHDSAPVSHETPIAPAIEAVTGHIDVMGVGGLGYYSDITGSGSPVVLFHSINAAASSREMRPLFDGLRGRRRVFALDLPGFGRSERGDREYTPELYSLAMERFIVDVASPTGEPVDAVALSLSSEFLARVAVRTPELFRSLTLISPTGLAAHKHNPSRLQSLLPSALRLPLVSEGLFRLLRTERSVRYFLQKAFVGRPDESLVQYAVTTAAAPGARHAPVAFLSGKLFTPDADRTLYTSIRVPTQVVCDTDPYTGFEHLDTVTRQNPHVTAVRVQPTRGMPQYEKTEAVLKVIERVIEGASTEPPPRDVSNRTPTDKPITH